MRLLVNILLSMCLFGCSLGAEGNSPQNVVGSPQRDDKQQDVINLMRRVKASVETVYGDRDASKETASRQYEDLLKLLAQSEVDFRLLDLPEPMQSAGLEYLACVRGRTHALHMFHDDVSVTSKRAKEIIAQVDEVDKNLRKAVDAFAEFVPIEHLYTLKRK